jgi:hypothetical protein
MSNPRDSLSQSEETGPSPSDVPFDEHERRKLDALAEPFLGKSVANLPAVLEGTINGYHNENASRLIEHADELARAQAELGQINERLTNALNAAVDARRREAVVYEQLRSIDSEREKDVSIVAHQAEVRTLLRQIWTVSRIEDRIKQSLENPRLADLTSLDDLYQIVTEAARDIRSGEVPKICEGLAVWQKRIELLTSYLTQFKNQFTRFMEVKLGNLAACRTFAATMGNVISMRYVPNLDDSAPQTPFSENVERHEVLASVFPYWRFLYWIRDFAPDCYVDIARKYYLRCANEYLSALLSDMVREKNALITPYLPKSGKSSSSEPYALGNELTSDYAVQISAKLKETLATVFDTLRVEACVLTEFWGIDDSQSLASVVPKDLIEVLVALFTSVSDYDRFFAMKSYGICHAAAQRLRIPINSIVDDPKKRWNKFVQKQKAMLADVKTSKIRTVILSVFQQFPLFFAKYCEMAEPVERPVLESSLSTMTDDVVEWLIWTVAPKYSKKKRALLVVVNLLHLCEKLQDQPAVRQSTVLNECLQRNRELLDQNIQELLNFIVSKGWSIAATFFEQITLWLKRPYFTSEMVTFQPTHTDQQFADLNDKLERKTATYMSDTLGYIKQKVHHEGLAHLLRTQLNPFLRERFALWDKLAFDCYGTHIGIKADQVAALIDRG